MGQNYVKRSHTWTLVVVQYGIIKVEINVGVFTIVEYIVWHQYVGHIVHRPSANLLLCMQILLT